jgi:hypothetical protein
MLKSPARSHTALSRFFMSLFPDRFNLSLSLIHLDRLLSDAARNAHRMASGVETSFFSAACLDKFSSRHRSTHATIVLVTRHLHAGRVLSTTHHSTSLESPRLSTLCCCRGGAAARGHSLACAQSSLQHYSASTGRKEKHTNTSNSPAFSAMGTLTRGARLPSAFMRFSTARIINHSTPLCRFGMIADLQYAGLCSSSAFAFVFTLFPRNFFRY